MDSIYANCDSLRSSVRADFSLADIATPSRPWESQGRAQAPPLPGTSVPAEALHVSSLCKPKMGMWSSESWQRRGSEKGAGLFERADFDPSRCSGQEGALVVRSPAARW